VFVSVDHFIEGAPVEVPSVVFYCLATRTKQQKDRGEAALWKAKEVRLANASLKRTETGRYANLSAESQRSLKTHIKPDKSPINIGKIYLSWHTELAVSAPKIRHGRGQCTSKFSSDFMYT
jgi:hypothetical protein